MKSVRKEGTIPRRITRERRLWAKRFETIQKGMDGVLGRMREGGKRHRWRSPLQGAIHQRAARAGKNGPAHQNRNPPLVCPFPLFSHALAWPKMAGTAGRAAKGREKQERGNWKRPRRPEGRVTLGTLRRPECCALRLIGPSGAWPLSFFQLVFWGQSGGVGQERGWCSSYFGQV